MMQEKMMTPKNWDCFHLEILILIAQIATIAAACLLKSLRLFMSAIQVLDLFASVYFDYCIF